MYPGCPTRLRPRPRHALAALLLALLLALPCLLTGGGDARARLAPAPDAPPSHASLP